MFAGFTVGSTCVVVFSFGLGGGFVCLLTGCGCIALFGLAVYCGLLVLFCLIVGWFVVWLIVVSMLLGLRCWLM